MSEPNPPPPFDFDDLSEWKKKDREQLASMSPEEAQTAVDQVLFPRLWRIADPSQLAWPGDMADETDKD